MKFSGLIPVLIVCLRAFISTAQGSTTNVFFTGFETAEGYNNAVDLIGQVNWRGFGSGGNRLIPSGLQGQSAYVGHTAPNPGDGFLFVYRPLNFPAVASGFPVVTFSVLMKIASSQNGRFDFFQWQVYNSQGSRLFLLDFDAFEGAINYRLDGTNTFQSAGVNFVRDRTYTLTVTMNFAGNLWSASLDNTVIRTNEMITTTNALLDLGDVDAVWQPFDPSLPGDNFMLFDNYRVTARVFHPATVQLLDRPLPQGWSSLRVNGEPGSRWALEAASDLLDWTSLGTNQVFSGSFDMLDQGAASQPRFFYRARLVP